MESLTKERDFVEAVLQSVDGLVVVIDRHGRIVRFNRACELATGYGFEEIAGESFWEILLPYEERDAARRGFELLHADHYPKRHKGFWLTKWGDLRLVDWSNTALLGADGAIDYLVCTGTDITGERVGGRNFDETRMVLEALVEIAPTLIVLCDPEGRIVLFNRACETLTGHNRAEVIGGMAIDLFVPPEWASVAREAFTGITLPGVRVPQECPWLTKSGEERIIEWRCTPLPTPYDDRPFVLGLGIDVTERRQIEEALRTSEERFRLVACATNDMVWDWDLLTGDIWWNETLERLYGYAVQENHNLTWWDQHVHPDDRSHVISSLQSAVQMGAEVWTSEYRFRRADGSYAFVLDRGFVVRDTAGQPVRMIGVMMDLTQYKEAEERLQASEQRSRAILNSLLSHIAVLDHEGRIVAVNESWNEFGRKNGLMMATVGTNYVEVCRRAALLDETVEGVLLGIDRVLSGEQPSFTLEYPCHRPEVEQWFQMNVTALYGQSGAVVSHTDITERKLAEQTLQQSHAELEMRVEERTADIKEMVQQLERARMMQNRFLADASHDLRTPLTIVRAEMELLLSRADLDPKTRESLVKISVVTERLALLATDLLLLATVEAKQLGSAQSRVRLDELLLECVVQMKTLAAQKEIVWRISIDEVIEIGGNGPTLRRAMTNVLENAIKYSPPLGTILVKLERDEVRAIVTIEDQGPGVPAEDLPRVFDRYYRGDGARETPGTGLGLSIVKAIAEAHGGAVRLESSGGSGTSVIISLPI